MGHYAVALAIHAKQPTLPLWAWIGAVQVMDLLWAVLVMTGIEKIRMDSSLASVPVDMYFIPYSHGLPVVLLMSLVGALLCRWLFKCAWQPALWLAFAIWSHWGLDLLVHHKDLVLWGDVKVGLGLWNYPSLSVGLEVGLIGLAGMFWVMSAYQAKKHQGVMFAFVALLIGVQLLSYAMPLPAIPFEMASSVLMSHLVVIGLSVWVERKLKTDKAH